MRRVLALALLTGAVAGPLSWAISDRLEARNDFCVSCHLDWRPLHETKHEAFGTAPPPNLVASHRASQPAFRCIDCHGGASFSNKLRVKLVAARDAARYALGLYAEPEHMRHPLWDEDCRQCHERYDPERDDDFHATADHNAFDFAFRCVECHRSHPVEGVSEAFAFLDRAIVLPLCGECHEEFEED